MIEKEKPRRMPGPLDPASSLWLDDGTYFDLPGRGQKRLAPLSLKRVLTLAGLGLHADFHGFQLTGNLKSLVMVISLKRLPTG